MVNEQELAVDEQSLLLLNVSAALLGDWMSAPCTTASIFYPNTRLLPSSPCQQRPDTSPLLLITIMLYSWLCSQCSARLCTARYCYTSQCKHRSKSRYASCEVGKESCSGNHHVHPLMITFNSSASADRQGTDQSKLALHSSKARKRAWNPGFLTSVASPTFMPTLHRHL